MKHMPIYEKDGLIDLNARTPEPRIYMNIQSGNSNDVATPGLSRVESL